MREGQSTRDDRPQTIGANNQRGAHVAHAIRGTQAHAARAAAPIVQNIVDLGLFYHRHADAARARQQDTIERFTTDADAVVTKAAKTMLCEKLSVHRGAGWCMDKSYSDARS